jgi:outer membrane receptor protein involved in Fe transport
MAGRSARRLLPLICDEHKRHNKFDRRVQRSASHNQIPANSDGSVANGQRYFRDHNIATFVQHDWKVTQNLTINTGLRWEYFEPLYNKGFGINQPVFGSTSTNFLAAARLTPVNHLTNSNYNNWGPKIGFAWSPSRANIKMVLRGGFGVS